MGIILESLRLNPFDTGEVGSTFTIEIFTVCGACNQEQAGQSTGSRGERDTSERAEIRPLKKRAHCHLMVLQKNS
jgi:hypothetical protein